MESILEELDDDIFSEDLEYEDNLSMKDRQCIEVNYNCYECAFRYTGYDRPNDEDLCVYDMEF